MKTLKKYIVENSNAARGARKKRRRDRDPAAGIEPVRVILGLDAAAAVLLPAGLDLETRAEQMNEFWRALVQFQYQDLIVAALCANDER